jgi:tetratricopeptide (TPR) repeat protein
MAVNHLGDTQRCVDFFQQRLRDLLTYWSDHEAVQQLQITILDREREMILKVITLGLDVAPRWPLVRPLIIALTPYMERRGHWETWHEVLQKAIGVAQCMSDSEHEVTLTALLARLYQRMSRLQDVVRTYRRGIRLARRTNSRFEEARACSNLGYLYIESGYWWRAEVLSCHALAIFEELESDHGRAHTHNHLGVLYTRLRRWQQAETHLQQACSLWLTRNDEHSMVYGFLNLGLHHVEQEKSMPAIEYLSQALEYALRTGERSVLGTIWNNMASAYRHDKEIEKATLCAQQAEAIHREFHNTLGLAQVWNNLGLIHLQKNDLSQADSYFNNSLQTYRQIGHKLGEVQVLLDIVELHRARHDLSKAREDLRLLAALLAQQDSEVFKVYHLRVEEHSRGLPSEEQATGKY